MAKQLITLTCTNYDSKGKGIVIYNKKKYAFSNLIPQEKATFDFSNSNNPRLVEILEPSKNRIKPICDQYEKCGGCQLLHMDKQEQQLFKTELTKQTFKPLQSILKTKINDCEMADDPYYYRNKVQLPVSINKKRQMVMGFYKENTIEIIEKDDCFIQTKAATKIIETIRKLINQYKVQPFDFNSHKGTLKYVLIRYGFTTNELMVVFVTNGDSFKFQKQFTSTLLKEVPEIKTIIQNINNRKDHLVLDRNEKIWYGKGYIVDYIGDVKFLISSKSFYQINPPQVKKMYDCIKDFAGLTGKETVIDAYCGVGTIGLYLANKAKEILGVELIVQAIDDAKKNAKLNHINNAYFQVGDASKYMVNLAKQRKMVDVVIVDPPRSGCTPELIQSVIKLAPKKFIYVSCNIETQARDLELMKKSGYVITKVQPFDLFPQTYHVESVVLITRKDK